MPRRIAVFGSLTRTDLPFSSICPASSRSAPKMARATSVLPAPIRPARPSISPSHAKLRLVKFPLSSEPGDAHDFVAENGSGMPVKIVEAPPHHHLDERIYGHGGDFGGIDAGAVPQDRYAIRDLKNFLESVGNVDDRYSSPVSAASSSKIKTPSPFPSAPKSAHPV